MSSFLHGPCSSKPSPPSRSPRNSSKPRKSNEARRRATFRIAGRTACHARCIKSLRSLLPIQLHRSLHADGCHAKSPDDIALLGITAYAELTGDHPKGCDIFLTMGKHRHVPVEIRYATILFLKRQFAGDVGHAGRKHRQMKLGHGTVSPDEGKKKTAPLTQPSSQNPLDSAS